MKNTLLFSAFFTLFLTVAAFMPPPPVTAAQLGERLFFDPILSLDSTVSCSSCHIPAFGFADTLPFSRGVGGRMGRRNSSGITNMRSRSTFFYDGRAATLEDQILMPIQDTLEMRASLALVTGRLQQHPEYSKLFSQLFGHQATADDLAAAIAAYIRTLETGNTPFDRWIHGKPKPMGEAAVRGRKVFMLKGKCFDCHFSPDFTGDEFRNIGLYTAQRNLQDRGRFDITHDSTDLGRFKVPGLRNVALTAPYMHNGMFRTLEEVIEYYDQPNKTVPNAINRDSLLARPLGLTVEEKADLKAFLEALTDERFKKG